MTLSDREKAVAITALGVGLVAIVGIALYLTLNDFGFPTDPNASYNRDQVCRQEAHELGFRFLDYVHPFGECWAQRPDGSIVDLFAEAKE